MGFIRKLTVAKNVRVLTHEDNQSESIRDQGDSQCKGTKVRASLESLGSSWCGGSAVG